MLVVVAAIAPPQSFLGRDFVHAQTVDDARLSALSLGEDADSAAIIPTTGDGEFMPDTMTYSVRAAGGTGKVTVAATAMSPNATFTISPPDRDSAEGHQVILTAGGNTVIRVTVRSEDRTVTETYTVTVYQERTTPSDNENLSSLRLSSVTLSPSFASSRTMYTGRVTYSTEDTTVSYRKDIGATVAIAADPAMIGNPVTDTVTTEAGITKVVLAAGAVTTINVAVTAEDQVGEADPETKTYTVMVYRENLVKSDDTRLAAQAGLTLTVYPGAGPVTNFTYVEGTKSYDVQVESGVRAVTVAATTWYPGAVAVIRPSDQDTETTAEGHQVLLSAGAKTPITVEVTAEDGTTDTFSVTIYRLRRVQSDDADLSALRLSSVTLSPSFASSRTMYTGRVTYSTEQTTVSYTADIGATVDIEDEEGTAITDADAASGHQVPLDAGVITEINVAVTAENPTTEKTYTVMIYRENLVKSDNPRLNEAGGLALTQSADGTIFTDLVTVTDFDFMYDDETKSYPDVRVANDGSSAVTVAAVTAHMGAVAVITPSDQDPLMPRHQVLLPAGTKTNITVSITAEDGANTDTYSITIYRLRRVQSDDADLSALSLSDVMLSPEFASNKTSYTARVGYSTEQTTLAYTADSGAMVAKQNYMVDDGVVMAAGDAIVDADLDASDHQFDLVAGEVTAIPVLVTAENGTLKGYRVSVYRENLPLSDNASLAGTEVVDGRGIGLTLGYKAANAAANAPLTPIAAGAGFTYAPADKSYPNVRVGNDVQVVTVTTNTAQDGAMVVITPPDQDSLVGGHQVILGVAAKTNITITVTAEDGITTDTYNVTIYRARDPESMDANLSALSLSDVVLTPSFDPDKRDYVGSAATSTELTTLSYTADIGARMVAIRDDSGTDGAPGGIVDIPDVDSDPSNGHQGAS